MSESWRQWEGQVIDGVFPLRQYLGGSDHSAVFLTDYGRNEPQKAAIKLIPTDAANAERSLSRLHVAATLSHPHLIRLFLAESCRVADSTLLYVVMEYAEEDLSQLLPQRPLTAAEAQEVLPPVLEVLKYIHARGLVCGHLKPANVMAVSNQVKVASDGICRIGELIGGPGRPSLYDAPENAIRGITSAGDVWSLGMTLVEALTQRLPVSPGQQEPPVPGTLPEPFLDIAAHCLRRDPQQRWTVGQIQDRLLPVATAGRAEATPPAKKPAKWTYLVVAGVVLALLAIVAGSRLHNRPSEPVQAPANAPATPESKAPEVAERKTTEPRFLEGAVREQVVPDVPQQARDTIRGTVRVTVRAAVDPSGNVEQATLDAPGPSKYFAGLAVQAARGWKFTPRKRDGRNIASEWLLHFQFERTGTKVLPSPVAP